MFELKESREEGTKLNFGFYVAPRIVLCCLPTVSAIKIQVFYTVLMSNYLSQELVALYIFLPTASTKDKP
jgi:hypothetical protein